MMIAWLLLACSQPSPPDLLLVTLDTTRADALGAYGQSPSPTPNLDALAARGLRVDEAMTVTPLTLPAHASMLTGLYPDAHGVRDNLASPLGAGHRTVAEQLSEAGYVTGAFVGAIVLDSMFGLDQGFATYEDGFDVTGGGGPGDAIVQWTAEQVVTRAERWLEQVAREEAPFFAWVHLYDAHEPLQAPERFTAAHPDPYLAEVAYVDEQVGRLLDRLEALGREDVVVLVVGDHGEGRGEHGEQLHGLFVYRSTMRVPMLLAGPGVPVSVMDGPRSVVDVAPTLLELAGLPAPAGDGVSLLRDDGDRFVYGESWHPRWQYGLAELRVLQDERWRFVLAPRPELYEWRIDPGEGSDRAPGPEADAQAERLQRWLDGRTVAPVAPGSADEETVAALARLGYLEGAAVVPAEVSYADLPDPKDHPDMVERFEALVVAARTRPPADAVPLLEAFLAERPGVGGARHLLSTARELSGDPSGAREALAPLLEARPHDPALRTRTAELLLVEGQLEPARALAEAVVVDQPSYAAAYAVLGEIARRSGDCAGAIRQVDAGLRHSPDSTRLRLVRGACREAAGDLVGAESDLRAVLAGDPQDPDAGFLLGLVLARGGRVDEALPWLQAQLDRTPDRPIVQAALGMALYTAGRWAEAQPHLLLAAPHPEVGDEPPLLLADTLLRVGGELSEVERWLDVAERRAPGDPQIHRVRAALHMARGDVDAAISETRLANQP